MNRCSPSTHLEETFSSFKPLKYLWRQSSRCLIIFIDDNLLKRHLYSSFASHRNCMHFFFDALVALKLKNKEWDITVLRLKVDKTILSKWTFGGAKRISAEEVEMQTKYPLVVKDYPTREEGTKVSDIFFWRERGVDRREGASFSSGEEKLIPLVELYQFREIRRHWT